MNGRGGGNQDRTDEELRNTIHAAIRELERRREIRRRQREPFHPPRMRPLPETIYHETAAAYRAAVHCELPPLETLHKDSGIPRGTIARWISTARQQGLLPQTTPGKARA